MAKPRKFTYGASKTHRKRTNGDKTYTSCSVSHIRINSRQTVKHVGLAHRVAEGRDELIHRAINDRSAADLAGLLVLRHR